MEDKQQKQAEMMLKSLEMMAQSMDTSSSLEEMAKLVADLIKFTQQNEQHLSTGFENLRSMFLQAQRDLKDEHTERFDTLKARLKAQIDSQIESIRSSYKGLDFEVKDIFKRLKDIENKEFDFEPFIEEAVTRSLEKTKIETPEETADRLNTRQEIIEPETIIGLVKRLNDLEKKIKESKSTAMVGGLNGLGARELIKDIDLSSQLDGVTTTFNIQAVWNIVNVSLSSYPYGSLRKNIDYTWTPTSITFTSEIDPATQLSAGQKCILTIVQA